MSAPETPNTSAAHRHWLEDDPLERHLAERYGSPQELERPECGWDDYERCAHGIREDEWCVQCPWGGV